VLGLRKVRPTRKAGAFAAGPSSVTMYSSPRANVTSLDQVPLVMIACGVFVTTVGANAAVARLPLIGRTMTMFVVADTVGTYPVVGSATDAGYSHLPVVAVGAYLVVDSAAFLGTTFGPVTTDGANSAVTSVAVDGVTLTDPDDAVDTVGAYSVVASATVAGVTLTFAVATTAGANSAVTNAAVAGVTLTFAVATTVGANSEVVNATVPGVTSTGVAAAA